MRCLSRIKISCRCSDNRSMGLSLSRQPFRYYKTSRIFVPFHRVWWLKSGGFCGRIVIQIPDQDEILPQSAHRSGTPESSDTPRERIREPMNQSKKITALLLLSMILGSVSLRLSALGFNRHHHDRRHNNNRARNPRPRDRMRHPRRHKIQRRNLHLRHLRKRQHQQSHAGR